MKNILTQLFGDLVTDDVMAQFNKELGAKFVAKADYNNKLERIKTLETDKGTLETKVNDLIEKANSNEDYKSQWEKLKKEIEDEKEAQKKAKEDAELTDSITAVFGDKKFTSDYVRKRIYRQRRKR